MAVPEQTPYKEYTANGITKIFPLEFDVLEQDHLIVLVNDLEPSVGSWSLDALNDTVVFVIPPANGANIKIRRDTPMSRSTDYQTYNNSFRPEPVNKDLDNIWRKLQEMGVLNWMVDNNIKDLGDYVDSLNDETKAQFLAEIQKQGTSLEQLDTYVDQLYKNLANVSADNGWYAEFIADGNENQKEINDKTIRYVKDFDELSSFKARRNGQVVIVKSINKKYTYDAFSVETINGVTIIGSTLVGRWIMEIPEAYFASWFATKNSTIDQAQKLQTGWDYAALKNRKYIFDGEYHVALSPRVYSDGLIRKIGLQVPDNSYAEFTDSACLRVIPNAEPLGYIINFYLAENFQLWNPVIYGDADQHLGTTDESNHCFNIVNCKKGYIHKPIAYNAWGDGIYLGVEYSSQTNKQLEDVTVFEPYAEHCGRAGMSITSGKNVNVYSPKFKDTYRVAPFVGLNIEGEGIGLTKPIMDNINIHGKIETEDCQIAASVFLFDSIQGTINIKMGEVLAKNCLVPVSALNFANNIGTVIIGDIHAERWKSSVLRCNWSQLNCELTIGNIYSTDAMCNGFIERYSSIISIDIDSELQPKTFIGNVKIGDIFIKESNVTKILHPLYYKDNTTEPESTRPLGRIQVGKINGKTRHDSFFADGLVSADFKFEMTYTTSYFSPPYRPFLYSKINIEASGVNFELNIKNDYRTPLAIVKTDITSAQLKVTFPNDTSLFPLNLGANKGIQTMEIGSRLEIEWLDGQTAFVINQAGIWSAY